MSLFLRSSLLSVSPDPQCHGPELLPALRHLLDCHQHQWWLHGPVLYILKVHQTEIYSRLVIQAQTPADPVADPSRAFKLHVLPPKESLPREPG